MTSMTEVVAEAAAGQVTLAIVMEHRGRRVCVSPLDRPSESFDCDLLSTVDAGNVTLAEGDTVLVWRLAGQAQQGVILGRIGTSNASTPTAEMSTEEIPDECLIEAKQSLTLRVGDGSITIRADGKILIKGRDLVSHAQRVNRIKGGSVSIN